MNCLSKTLFFLSVILLVTVNLQAQQVAPTQNNATIQNSSPNQNGIKDSTVKLLATVTVNKKLPKPELQVNERYTRGMFSNMMNVKVLDYINHPPSDAGIPIMDYLQGKIPGLIIRPSANGYEIKSTRISTLTDDAGIKLYLDDQETSADFLSYIYPKDVALVKYFPPGGALITGGAASSGLLIIYTRKGDDLLYYKNTKSEKN